MPLPFCPAIFAFGAGSASCTTTTEISAGEMIRVELSDGASQACFRFEASAGGAITIELIDAAGDPGDFVNLLFRWNDSPTSAGFNYIANSRGPNQRLVIPDSQDGTAFITVLGTFLNGGMASVDLRVSETASPLVEEMVPAYQGIGGDRLVRARIAGARFTPGVNFILQRSDCPGDCLPVGSCPDCYPATRIDAVYPDTAEVEFDLSTAKPGVYNLIARLDGNATRLDDAFELRSTDQGPVLKVEVDGQSQYRDRYPSSLNLRVRNDGDQPMLAPILRVQGPARAEITRLSISGKPFSQRDELYVLAYPQAGVEGFLPAGVEVEIPIEFRSDIAHDCPGHRCRLSVQGACDTEIRVSVLHPSGREILPWLQLDSPAGMEAIWEAPAGVEGDNIRMLLSEKLGTTWRSFHESMVNIATRLARRGQHTFSLAEIFRFAVREVLGRPAAGISGTARDATTGTPLEGQMVLAIEDGATRSSAKVGPNGRFTVDWLEEGKTYDIKVIGFGGLVSGSQEYTVDPPSLTLPADSTQFNDLVGLAILAGLPVAPTDLAAACANCDQSDLPVEPIKPTCSADPRLFFQYAGLELNVIGSFDPNEKDGSGNESDGDLIQPDEEITYTVYFENISGTPESELPIGGAAARNVYIRDNLKTDVLDVGTLQFGGLYIAVEPEPINVTFNGNGGPFFGDPDLLDCLLKCELTGGLDCDCFDLWSSLDGVCRELLEASIGGGLPGNNCLDCSACWLGEVKYHAGEEESIVLALSATAKLNVEKGRVTWTLVAHAPWEQFDLESGFLPFGCSGEGEGGEEPGGINACSGFVTFHILPVGAGLPDENQLPDDSGINNDAEIEFDHSRYSKPDDVIDTEEVRLTVQRQAPRPPEDETSDEMIPEETRLSWSSVYAQKYDLYVWPSIYGEERSRVEEFTVAETDLVEPVFPPVLDDALVLEDREYYRQVVARNEYGNTPGEVWSLFQQSTFRRGDGDASGTVDITDPINSLRYQFLGDFVPTCLDALDSDDNGAIEISDPIFTLTYLFLGGVLIEAPGPEMCGPDPTEDGLGCEGIGYVCN